MYRRCTKNIIIALAALSAVGYIYNELQSRIIDEPQASMLDIKGNMSWVLDLVHHMNPENPAREAFISQLKNYGVSKKFLEALQSEIAPPQKRILK